MHSYTIIIETYNFEIFIVKILFHFLSFIRKNAEGTIARVTGEHRGILIGQAGRLREFFIWMWVSRLVYIYGLIDRGLRDLACSRKRLGFVANGSAFV